MLEQLDKPNDDHVVSFLTLRKAIGVIGIALPIVLVGGRLVVNAICPGCGVYRGPTSGYIIQSSISSYYWTVVGDILVGGLCAIGIFLFAYKGKRRRDDLAGDLACIFAVGVAFFPTSPGEQPTTVGTMHYISAAGLFITLAYFCLVIFQEDDIGPTDRLKPARNRVYRICGYVIVGCILGIVAVSALRMLGRELPQIIAPVFWLEAIAIWAFGWSWFVKGKGLNILRTASAEKSSA